MTSSALSIAIASDAPTILWGPPGTGKTSHTRAAARQLGWECLDVIVSLRDPTDFGGLPVVSGGIVKLAPPSWATAANAACERDGGCVLFFDEFSTAPPATQAACLRVFLDRVVGDLQLHPGCRIVLAANPPEQAAGGWDLAPPMANRLVHLDYNGLDASDWAMGLTTNQWPAPEPINLPKDWRTGAEAARGRSYIASFLQHRPSLLHTYPKSTTEQSRAWPSRRSWTQAASILGAALTARLSLHSDEVAELISGCVGPGPTTEFLQWVRSSDLPDPEVLLADPSRYQHPKRGDLQYAALSGVVAAAIRQHADYKQRWFAAWEIMRMALEAGSPDIVSAVGRALANRERLPKGVSMKDLAGNKALLKVFEVLTKAGVLA